MIKRLSPDVSWKLLGLVGAFFCIFIYSFWPGWMTTDSLAQYINAREDLYHDWHPVLMAFYWNKLLYFSDGPQGMLMHNLIFYCGGVLLFSTKILKKFGWQSAVISVLTLMLPSLTLILGTIWKDTVFATSLFFVFSIFYFRDFTFRKITYLERLVVIFLITLSIGTKPNGVFAVFFLVLALFKYKTNSFALLKSALNAIMITSLFVGLAILIVPNSKIIKSNSYQYMALHDCLGITTRTQKMYMPTYIQKIFGDEPQSFSNFYTTESNNPLFFNSQKGCIATSTKEDLAELRTTWKRAVLDNPITYLKHRFDIFSELMRFDSNNVYITNVGILKNNYGLEYHHNPSISNFYYYLIGDCNRLYLPWVCCLITIFVAIILIYLSKFNFIYTCLFGSMYTFILPHFFIAPASDYRYLYYGLIIGHVIILLSAFDIFFHYRKPKPKAVKDDLRI